MIESRVLRDRIHRCTRLVRGHPMVLAAGILLVAAALLLPRWRGAQPQRRPPKPPPAASREHREAVERLRRARAAGDLETAADVQGELSRAAFAAAVRTARAWVGLRALYGGLLPRDLRVEPQVWNYGDVAADCYGHLVVAAHLLVADLLPDLRALLEQERGLRPTFTTIDFATGEPPPDETRELRVFGGVEYAKDGLLPILEIAGDGDWAVRLDEVVDDAWRQGRQSTRRGAVVHPGAETNGEMLQVLARLWHRSGDPRTLERGRAIAAAWLEEALPANDGLPPRFFDFGRGKVKQRRTWLRDHGNEMVVGLAEWMLVERRAPDGQSARFAPAMERMLDGLIDTGRRPDGLWRIRAGEADGPHGLLNDNWGYVSAGFVAYAFTLAEDDARRGRYLDAARGSMRGAASHRGANWENGRMDGFADTLEGGLMMLAFFDDPEVADWVDDESGRFLAYAGPDGFVGRTYLDGNFIRTAILYGRWKSAGILPAPWRPDLSLGVERAGDTLVISATADEPWRGVLRFDRPRHREILRLPFDYPRLNSWPEWFAVEPDAEYEIANRGRATATSHSGAELARGLSLELAAGETVRLRLRRLSAPSE